MMEHANGWMNGWMGNGWMGGGWGWMLPVIGVLLVVLLVVVVKKQSRM